MNKKGAVFFGIILGISIFIFGVLFIPFLMDDITTFRSAMNCASPSSITSGDMLSCLISDTTIPYLIWFFSSLALGLIMGGKK